LGRILGTENGAENGAAKKAVKNGFWVGFWCVLGRQNGQKRLKKRLKKRTGKKARKSGLKRGSAAAGGGLAEAALLKQKADLYGFWWYGFGTTLDPTRPAPARGAGGLSPQSGSTARPKKGV